MSLMSDRAAAKKKPEASAERFPVPTPAKAAAPVAPPVVPMVEPAPPVTPSVAPPAPVTQSAAVTPPAAVALPADPIAAFAVTAEEFSIKDSPIEALDIVVPPVESPVSTVALAPTRRVRVLADGKVLLGACMHRFRAGNVLDANQYDNHVFGQLLKALKTEPIEN